MTNPFFERPILNSPYECPQRHWELDHQGQPTQQIVETRRWAEFITPIPKPRKRKSGNTQQQMVQAIRAILDSLDLETDPDFGTAWIDEPIWLRLKEGILTSKTEPVSANGSSGDQLSTDLEEIVLESTPSAVKRAAEQSESAPTSAEPEAPKSSEQVEGSSIDDPTFRIGSLPAANKKLVVVNQNDSVTKAITLMLQHDFSQMPVMQGEREVKGVVTWKSIGSKLALGCKADHVGECREDARIVDSNRTLFDAIPTIVEFGYVLVRDQRDRRITGM